MTRRTWLWVAGGVAAALLLTWVLWPRAQSGELDVTAFGKALSGGQVRTATITFQNGTAVVTGQLEGGPYRTRTLAADPLLNLEALQAQDVNVSYGSPPRLSVLGALSLLLTLALIVGLKCV